VGSTAPRGLGFQCRGFFTLRAPRSLDLQIGVRIKLFAANHPNLLKALAAAPIAPLGDFICQQLEIARHSSDPIISSKASSFATSSSSRFESSANSARSGPKQFDWQRFGAAVVFGACVSAPVGVWWFPWIDRIMKTHFKRMVEGSVPFVMAKTAAEGVLIGPPFTVSYFCIVSAIQGGEKWETLVPRMKQDIVATNIADQLWWLLVAPLNYKFIPVSSQIFFSNIATALELMAFSWIQHNRELPRSTACVDPVAEMMR